jgi:hypothetical protein
VSLVLNQRKMVLFRCSSSCLAEEFLSSSLPTLSDENFALGETLSVRWSIRWVQLQIVVFLSRRITARISKSNDPSD